MNKKGFCHDRHSFFYSGREIKFRLASTRLSRMEKERIPQFYRLRSSIYAEWVIRKDFLHGLRLQTAFLHSSLHVHMQYVSLILFWKLPAQLYVAKQRGRSPEHTIEARIAVPQYLHANYSNRLPKQRISATILDPSTYWTRRKGLSLFNNYYDDLFWWIPGLYSASPAKSWAED